MGFTESRKATVEALRDGRFQHEPRAYADGKNMLATGEITAEEVIGLLNRCRGNQHETSPHHFDPTQTVDIFKPTAGGVRWYIKSYLFRDGEVTAVFISVHQ
jgi:hypothetical protein